MLAATMMMMVVVVLSEDGIHNDTDGSRQGRFTLRGMAALDGTDGWIAMRTLVGMRVMRIIMRVVVDAQCTTQTSTSASQNL